MSHKVISAVSRKIPNPWPDNTEMWLTAVHLQFVTPGITQELPTFYYIFGALTPDLADRLRHITCLPPSEKPYRALWGAIIKLTALANHLRYIALLICVELGDRNPPHLIQNLENFIGDLKFDASFSLVQTLLAAFRPLQLYAN